MTRDQEPSERVRQYLKKMTLQARRSLLAEIERMALYGETMPGADLLLAELRAEFRGSGESHDRVGNPSRYFFQPIELLFVNRPAERTNPGQISRGSLTPIWEWISNSLLPTMTRDYCERMKEMLITSDPKKARAIAAEFQAKVLKTLDGTLAFEDGIRRAREDLAQYTTSRSVFDDLKKITAAMRVRDALDKLAKALPPKIDSLDGKMLGNVRGFLDLVAAEQSEVVPFALAIVARRLKMPWQLLRLATSTARGRDAAAIAASRFAAAVPIVLDTLDDTRMALKQAMKSDRVQVARDNLADIYEIEAALRDEIGQIETSEWGQKLDSLLAQVTADLDSEFHRLPEGTRHVLGALQPHKRGGLGSLLRRSRIAFRSLVTH